METNKRCNRILSQVIGCVCDHHRSEQSPVVENTSVILLPINPIPRDSLKQINDEICSKQPYEMICVGDFVPVDRKKRYVYIQQLKNGLSKACVLCTYSVGGPIGNYHFLWSLPPHVTMEAALQENQRLVSKVQTDAPAYHHRYLKKQLISRFGLISHSSNLFLQASHWRSKCQFNYF